MTLEDIKNQIRQAVMEDVKQAFFLEVSSDDAVKKANVLAQWTARAAYLQIPMVYTDFWEYQCPTVTVELQNGSELIIRGLE